MLAVPKDSLISLLGPRRSRGRWIGHIPGNLSFGTLLDDVRPLQALHKIGAPPRGALSRLSTQVNVQVDGDGRTSLVRVRELVRANTDRVSRCGVVYSADEQPSDPPALTDAKYCRVGRVAVDRSIGLIAGELILDRVLDAGDPALLKYAWTFSRRPRMVNYEHMFSAPRREFVLQIQFDPDNVPARCSRYDRRTVACEEANHRELWIGGSSTALLAELDVVPGIVGIRWEWPNSIGSTALNSIGRPIARPDFRRVVPARSTT